MISTLPPTAPPPSPADMGLEPTADGRMWLDASFRGRLEEAGLVGFEAVMRGSRGQCLRVLPDRENWRLELEKAGRPSGGFYLKKHHVRTWQGRLRAAMGATAGETAGRAEAENVARLAAAGVAAMRLVAFGEHLARDGREESFLLTEALAGFEPLDDFLRRRFPRSRAGLRKACDRRLLRLVREVAQLARRFHAAGYNHRDFYCCHFFVRETAAGGFEIRLIDLQRMQHRRCFRRRWLVKDLAQLAYSAPRNRIGCTLRLAFLRHYLGGGKLRPVDKRLVRQVLGKQKQMERRRGASA